MNCSSLVGKFTERTYCKIDKGLSIVFFFIFALLNGCEQTINNPQLPYEEKLVIAGSLYSNLARVYVSRTLPLTQKYTDEAALVRDAKVTLTLPDGSVSVLSFDTLSNFYRIYNINTLVGANHTLRVEWKSLVATATTILPPEPLWEIDSVKTVDTTLIQYDPDTPYLYKDRAIVYLTITSPPNINCKASYVSFTSNDTNDFSSMSFTEKLNLGKNGTKDSNWYSQINIKRDQPIKGFQMYLSSSTTALDDFFESQENRRGNGRGSIFGSFGKNPPFNVSGDGIGVFDGYAYSAKNVFVSLE